MGAIMLGLAIFSAFFAFLGDVILRGMWKERPDWVADFRVRRDNRSRNDRRDDV